MLFTEWMRGRSSRQSTRRSSTNRRSRGLRLEVLEGRWCPSAKPYLYIASFGTNTVERYEELSGAPAPPDGQTGATFVARNSGGLNHPLGLVLGPHDRNLYVTSLETNEVLQYDGDTGELMGAFVTSDEGLANPAGILFGPDGDLYVANAQPAASNIMRFDGTTGAFIDVFASLPEGGGATSIVFGPDGKLYVSTRFANGVDRCDASGCETFIEAGAGGLSRTGGFVFGPDGNFYVASENTNNILQFDGVTGEFLSEFVTAGSGGLSRPTGILFGPYGDLYVDGAGPGGSPGSTSNDVLHFDGATGEFINVFVSPHDDQILSGPRGLFFGNTSPTTLNYVPRREPTPHPPHALLHLQADLGQALQSGNIQGGAGALGDPSLSDLDIQNRDVATRQGHLQTGTQPASANPDALSTHTIVTDTTGMTSDPSVDVLALNLVP